MKSEVAAEAVKTINANMNVRVYLEGVVSETEYIYHDNIFEELSGIINASDNQKTRKHLVCLNPTKICPLLILFRSLY
jgi:molybdopterin/thiamine biosynthesis adenylyltransferase